MENIQQARMVHKLSEEHSHAAACNLFLHTII